MRSLIRRRPETGKADPAPSRWSWRMQRLMLTPGFRFALRVGLPFTVSLLAGTIYMADEERRGTVVQAIADVRASIQERPEFMVKLMAIDGASDLVSTEIRTALPLEFPLSSFDLDLPQVREKITSIDGVKQANVRIRPGGVLQIDVIPRVPVAVWRSETGLALVDNTGVHVARIEARRDHADLPLIAGAGAAKAVPEALKLIAAANVLGDRLRGLVRVGGRRWDVVLDRNQTIMLPEENALQALERVIALEGAQEVLTRDVARVDMRLAARPTLRMNEDATREWWHIRQLSGQ
ncbi:cell division protein FtsQ/DivIB [Sulfitobacter sp. W027]|jgi:cell division protein FtsQ|uniref:cell division protein FtsQ/DivIB n=1 Tax=Sulfitobacter sp. W027 TaxID=2867025 RepID=UPI0021A80254|nr:cell division protein FtsQ/DivIB [Sulfitobacter sp. W027]UWR34569.1 cell division protein FtsQ/DivIB [Sulfitobacter sp. W027]